MSRPAQKITWNRYLAQMTDDPRYRAKIDRDKHGPYRDYKKIFATLDRIVSKNRERVTPILIGESTEGEPIWGFRVVSDAGSTPRHAFPRFLVTSGIHAQEFITAETNIALMERVVNNMSQNTDLFDREIYFFPMMNPDGYLRTQHDLEAGHRHFNRSNRNGVDLNRNFSIFYSKKYYLNRLLPGIWHPGYRPFSEPETAALRSFLLETRFDYALSLHSFGGWFFYPYAGSKRKPRDEAWYAEITQEMIDRQPEYGYKAKQLGRFLPGFLARGAEIDYLYETFGTRSLLIEIGKHGMKALSPHVFLHPFHWFNPKDPQREIENLIEPMFYYLSQPRIRKID
ncbi:MAG: hypothetical protein HKN20_18660 [Gemmatimonadetes bacterium]|nr:hypothetical protein [Gemmatimonadota bacterium]